MGTDLWQQPGGARFCGFAKENSAKPQPTAQGFFNDAKAFDCTLTRSRQFTPAERLA